MGGMTTERSEVAKSEERRSMCEDKLMVVASASANEVDAVDTGKLMVERQSIGELEIARELVDVGSMGVRKRVVEDELLSMEESVGRERSTVVARMLLDVEDVVDKSGSTIATRLVAEIVEEESENGLNEVDGLSMQEETTSEIEKSKDIAVPTYR